MTKTAVSTETSLSKSHVKTLSPAIRWIVLAMHFAVPSPYPVRVPELEAPSQRFQSQSSYRPTNYHPNNTADQLAPKLAENNPVLSTNSFDFCRSLPIGKLGRICLNNAHC